MKFMQDPIFKHNFFASFSSQSFISSKYWTMVFRHILTAFWRLDSGLETCILFTWNNYSFGWQSCRYSILWFNCKHETVLLNIFFLMEIHKTLYLYLQIFFLYFMYLKTLFITRIFFTRCCKTNIIFVTFCNRNCWADFESM